jgi:hypothetical protein
MKGANQDIHTLGSPTAYSKSSIWLSRGGTHGIRCVYVGRFCPSVPSLFLPSFLRVLLGDDMMPDVLSHAATVYTPRTRAGTDPIFVVVLASQQSVFFYETSCNGKVAWRRGQSTVRFGP